jgi:hypothetical protein
MTVLEQIAEEMAQEIIKDPEFKAQLQPRAARRKVSYS